MCGKEMQTLRCPRITFLHEFITPERVVVALKPGFKPALDSTAPVPFIHPPHLFFLYLLPRIAFL